MKIQRSHFRLMTLFLVCSFLAVMLLCAVHIGLIEAPLPEIGEGNPPVAEESLNQPENLPESSDPQPAPEDDFQNPFDTNGL